MTSTATVQPSIEVLLTGNNVGSAEGHISFCGVFLVRGLDRSGNARTIVVDSGHVGRRPYLEAALADRGLAPADIDLVVLTHAHWDHVQNIDLFPDAEIAVSGAELDYIVKPYHHDIATPAWTHLLFRERRVRRLTPGDEVITGMTALDAAGHSAGSLAYALATDAGTALITGDALPFAAVAQTGQGMLVIHDRSLADATIARLREAGDVFYPGHDRPFRLAGDEVHYVAPFTFALRGVAPDAHGLTVEDGGPPVTTDLTAP